VKRLGADAPGGEDAIPVGPHERSHAPPSITAQRRRLLLRKTRLCGTGGPHTCCGAQSHPSRTAPLSPPRSPSSRLHGRQPQDTWMRKLLNVSRGGIGVRTKAELQTGEVVRLRFSLPGRKLVVQGTGGGGMAQTQRRYRSPLRRNRHRLRRTKLQLWLEGRYFES